MNNIRVVLLAVLIAQLSPVMTKITGYGYIELILPEVLVALLFVYALVMNSLSRRGVSFCPNLIYVYGAFFMFVVYISFVFALINQVRYGMFGVVSVALQTFMFYFIFLYVFKKYGPDKIYRFFTLLLVVHILFILSENLVHLFLGKSYLSQFYKYRYLLSVVTYFGVDMGAANSMFAGPQYASIITLISLIWFVCINFVRKRGVVLIPVCSSSFMCYAILVLTAVLAFINMSMTSLVVLLIVLSASVALYYSKNIFGFIVVGAFIVVLGWVFSDSIMSVVFYKISNDVKLSYYIQTTFSSVMYYFELPVIYMLLGIGDVANSQVPTEISHLSYPRTEFGLGMLLVKGGAILLFTIVIGFAGVVRMFMRVYGVMSSSFVQTDLQFKWGVLVVAFFLLIVVMITSLVHYAIVVHPGGRTLFALVLSLFLVSVGSYKRVVFGKDSICSN